MFKEFKRNSLVLLSSLGLIFSSCQVLTEDDISARVMTIIIPQNETITSNGNIHFKWNNMEEATSYHIELVSPSFNSINSFVIDSALSTNSFHYTLSPGAYEWRVKAVNYGSETQYTVPFKLTIDSSADLTNTIIQLQAPASEFYSNHSQLNFSWFEVSYADNYDFLIKEGTDFQNGVIAFSLYETDSTQKTGISLSEGAYTWGVRAKNGVPTISNYSTQTFYIDTTSPQEPTISSPANNAIYNDSILITFSWNIPTDIGNYPTQTSSIFYIYSDSLVTLFDTVMTTNNNLDYSFLQAGNYHYYVQLIDKAGNVSSFSNDQKVVIQ